VAVTIDAGRETDAVPGNPATPSARPAWFAGAVAGGAVACGCAAIALVNPTDSGAPVCWSAGVFGIDCPLCGGLRCVNSLVRGDLLAAADHNILLAVTLPVVAVLWVVWMVRAVQGRHVRLPSPPNWAWGVLAVVTLSFTVVRNLDLGPVAHWLAATAA
jgi:hypothetical protein